MPVSALPNLDHVYAKWENRGPKGRNTLPTATERNRDPARANPAQNGDAEQAIQSGKQKWRDKFGDNVKPLQRRRPRDRNRLVAVPAEIIQSATIAQFKTSPSILPEHFSTQRPMMGHCCSCLPNSQKDLITPATSTEGMRNILDVRHELRGSGVLSRQFSRLVYSWRTRTHHKYPELSMAVLTSQRVIDVIHAELLAEEVHQDRAMLEKRARDILHNMKSRVSNFLTKLTGWFLHHFLSLMLNGLVVHNGQLKMVKTASQRGVPLLFLPLHKSHLDYIIITFIMWNFDIKNPNIAAGDNLNIPFFGFLMRGLGGFFIRRKLDKYCGKKDVIYRSVLHSYMEQLLSEGENMEFFLEGGRSRTGKALQPKGGLLSVVIDSLTNGITEDLYIVPVSISYEKLLDGNFNNEQMGVAKKKESFFGAIRGIWSVVRNHYGNVRVDFAQPFSMKELLQACQLQSPTVSPDSSTGDFSSPGSPPSIVRISSLTSLYGTDVVIEDQRQLVNRIGLHVLHTCVQTSAVMSTHLLAFLLLTKHRQGTSLDTLIKDFAWIREEVLVRKRDLGFSPSSSTHDIVCYSLSLLGSNLVTWRTGGQKAENDVVPCVDMPTVFELSYYSNHVLSVFLLESIIVSAVIYLSDISLSTLGTSTPGEIILMSRDEILETAVQLSNLLKHEFISVPPCAKLEESLADILDHLVTSELLKIDDHQDQYDTYENVHERQWATRLSASLSWADGDDDEDNYCQQEQLLRVNLEHEDCKDKLRFFHSILAPFFEAYLVTAHNIQSMTEEEMTEGDFMKKLHSHAKSRVTDGVASYSESAALETLKSAVKSYKDVRIIDYYNAGGVSMLELHGRYDVRDSLHKYLQMLESLRG
ncbi:glycerol-3-phosphate acyltransferase 1, mitochondrial-like [Mercenaria mercenaria]|uniref:glycerol-3-phosphate acyltransferase 1, mitochondrial-like n=1 Tax=Mercenaria mercenaria TaxID=6596 RepID=UPI00234F01E5|nr:glycerol-3-phosphate acyltransferase 1, mitochondrial-like [Mercenaria mercenaria]XP_045189643.2 glycerol-3-phosphate acyltransferase 1, mitochondrial-like [Mercenaria mercenaria]XP_045189644.2 glycerol-3-phosphate acyltransferase 1, mitochondrial-like [Mercenaria mercenaria]